MIEEEMLKQREENNARESKLILRIDQLNSENKRQNNIILKVSYDLHHVVSY